VAIFGRQLGTPGDFDQPRGVAVDPAGQVYVSDETSGTIHKLAPDGQPLARWGGLGAAPGLFMSPRGLAADADGNIFVADHGNQRVQKLSSAGVPLAEYGKRGTAPLELSEPIAVARDSSANLYIWMQAREPSTSCQQTGGRSFNGLALATRVATLESRWDSRRIATVMSLLQTPAHGLFVSSRRQAN
jgi:sugar lactone lactonase YvrE